MNTQDFNQLNDYLTIISDLFQLPIFYINTDHYISIEKLATFKINPMYNSKDDMIRDLFDQYPVNNMERPVILSSKYFESYLLIPDDESNYILLGPVVYSKVNPNRIQKFFYDLQINEDSSFLQNYYDVLTVMDRDTLIQVGILVYFARANKKLSINDIVTYQELHQTTAYEKELVAAISINRDNLFTHIDPLYEQEMMQCIRNGRVQVLKGLLTRFPDGDDLDFLSKSSYLRSIKNIAIASITLATRAAVDGGAFYEKVFSLSDVYIQQLEEQHDSKAVLGLMKQVYILFAQMVGERKDETFSKPITMSKEYIFNHLYEEINVKSIADVVGLHPNYLSKLFKKETTTYLSEYIQAEKVLEASNLIRYSTYSFSQIANLLCFHDQSHFTRIFKKHTQLTPSAFKKQLL